MKDNVYIDTSALAKWYFDEPHAAEFTNYIKALDNAIISPLTKLEMRCLLSRKRRMQQLTPLIETEVYATFENDIEQGHLLLYRADESIYERARHLLVGLNTISLRTLDALHLAIVQCYGLNQLATADTVMADAAKAIGIDVKLF